MIGIYKITSPSGRVYVGQSVDIKRRFNDYRCLYNSKGQTRLFASFNKYGILKHLFEVIELCNEETLNKKERFWQEYYDCISKDGLNCNLTKTNDRSGRLSQCTKEKISRNRRSRKGIKLSDEHREKISKANKGKGNPFYGKKHTQETKDKIAEKNKLYTLTNIQKINHINGLKIGASKRIGQKRTLDQKETMSLAAKERNKIYGNGRSKCVINMDTGIFYDTIKEAHMSMHSKYIKQHFGAILSGKYPNTTSFKLVL